MSMAKEKLGGQLQSQANLSSNQVEQTMDVAKDSMMDSLKDQVLGGNLSGVMNLFNGQDKPNASNPIYQAFAGNFVSNLISKLGFGQDKAKMISDMATPFLMQKFGSSETGQAENESGLMSMLGMGGDNAITGMLKGFMGGGSGNPGGGLLGGLGKMFG